MLQCNLATKEWIVVKPFKANLPNPQQTSTKLKDMCDKLKQGEPLTLRRHLLDERHYDALITLVLAQDGEEEEEEDSAGATTVM
jgi:hypothetical protein